MANFHQTNRRRKETVLAKSGYKQDMKVKKRIYPPSHFWLHAITQKKPICLKFGN
jgi:hypothetical protein